MAREIKIYDTTLRDGTQGEGVAFSMEDKVRIAQRLDRLGVHYEHLSSEPDDDRFPQTAYFYVPDDSAGDVEWALANLSREHGFDAEVL